MSHPQTETVVSLGHRLKQLAKDCGSNKISEVKSSDDDSKYSSLNGLQEIALVEGYGPNSYTVDVLKDIKNKISNSNLDSALKGINTILPDIMAFDYKEFFALFEATKQTAERLKNQVCWVLLGPTGAGKSTSIHFFCGSRFKRGNGGSVIVDHIGTMLKNKDIHVGENVIESCTRYIADVPQDLSKYESIGFNRNEPTEILWVDSPGFEDTAGPEVNVANGIGTVRALKKAKAVKVIITFKEAHLDSKFKIIRNIANNMGKAINNLDSILDKNHGSPISGFLTQSNHGTKSAQLTFTKAYKAAQKKSDNSEENAVFKALIYKLGKKGPLFDIKIDVSNFENNEKNRITIIKALVEKTGYIKTPSTIFNEFISEPSLLKLKSQIKKDYDTIENILNYDKYFYQPKYIKYIIDILNNIDRLKEIIKNAGGKFVESELKKCTDTFKAKWDEKILKGSNILMEMDIKHCKIGTLNKKMKEFHDVKHKIQQAFKEIKSTKYYKECKLKDTNCLNDGLHDCFNELYKTITDYLENITNKIRSDSETDYDEKTDYDEVKSPKSPMRNKNIKMNLESIDDDNYKNSDYEYDKMIMSSIQKCCLLYRHAQQYKKDEKYIKKNITKIKKKVEDMIKYLKQKLTKFVGSRKCQNINGISTLMYMFSNLSKLYNISMTMDQCLKNNMDDIISREKSDASYDDEKEGQNKNSTQKSSKMVKSIEEALNVLKNNIDKTIQRICKSYNALKVLKVLESTDENIIHCINVEAIMNSKVIIKEDEIRKREEKLVSFCEWISKLNEELCGSDDNMFKQLQTWLNDTEIKWNKWLCNACLDELKKANDLLINKGASSWINVEKLLKECESLRKVEFVRNNTSLEYFKTLSEFDSGRTELSRKATQLIDDFNKGVDINYDELIKIAKQLYNAGCSIEKPEMKQIYNKLKEHLVDLKTTTEDIVLSIEMSDDLKLIQNTMKELDTLQSFASYMPDIKSDATGCYIVLNKQVMEVLNDIEEKYDLSKYSTQNSKDLKKELKAYLKVKIKINTDILENTIQKCDEKSLDEVINSNIIRIGKLESKNKQIEGTMSKKCGKIMEEIKKYEKLQKKGSQLLKYGEDGDLEEWLDAKSIGDYGDIKKNLNKYNDQLQTICSPEKKQKDSNDDKIKELIETNKEVKKCIEAEKNLKQYLKPDAITEYRMNNDLLQNRITELETLLEGNQKYIFSQKLPLYEAHSALKFLNKCKMIKWNLSNKIEEKKEDEFSNILSNKYVNKINTNMLKYLKAYGDILESNLNDSIGNLNIKDVSKCNLTNKDYVNSTQNIISKLNDYLREFREISNFEHQNKMDQENKNEKYIKLVRCLFTNVEIQGNVDKYINDVISMHKEDIMIKFAQFKIQRSDKLPILRFICISMSSLDRYVSLKKNEHDTYYRIASQIDSELTDVGDRNTERILPLFENGHWNRLKQVLNSLKKTAVTDPEGVAARVYRDATIQLFSAFIKLTNETKTKLLIEINPDNTVSNKKIIELKTGLDNVKNLVEIIYPHLTDESEQNKVKKEEKALGVLLADRLKQLMKSALTSAKKKDFKQCEKRLDNIRRLLNQKTQHYIDGIDEKDQKDEKDQTDEKDEIGNPIVRQFDNILQQITEVLNEIFDKVELANADLKENVESYINPYNRLRLKTLHDQLAKSKNEQFSKLWDDIYEDIVNTIQDVLNDIKQRNNQIEMRSEMETDHEQTKPKMSYAQQQALFRKIEISLSKFPTAMKDYIAILLKDAKNCAEVNTKYIGEGFQSYVTTNSWNEVANNLKTFENNDRNFFNNSKKQVISKISDIRKKHDENMKTTEGFVDSIDNQLDTYKSVGLSFTKFVYDDKNPGGSNIHIGHIQSQLDSMYKDIENRFVKQCKDIKACLNGHKSKQLLQQGFYIVVTVLQNVDKLPTNYGNNIKRAAETLYKPMQKLINTLKTRKNKGLNRDSHDIDQLVRTLDELKELNDVEFHANVSKTIPFMDEKDNIDQKDIESIDYEMTVNETKNMLKEFKDTIHKEGFNKNKIQQSQAKRVKYLKDLSTKIKSLIKSAAVSDKHFSMPENEFTRVFVEPCTRKMKNDIKQMKKETNDAFRGGQLNTKDLQRANANMEAFYCVKGVFEKEIDEKICNEIQIDQAIDTCEGAVTQKIEEISEEITKQGKNLNDDNAKDYFENTAQNLMNLEYLNQHMNFKTSINDNTNTIGNNGNELHQKVQYAIKKSMDFITNNKKTKKKINVLYNHLVANDPNYGQVFTQQHRAFQASLAQMYNKKFRELDFNAIISELKKTETEMHKQFNKLIPLDYTRVQDTYDSIFKKYNELVQTNLTSATSFEELQTDYIPQIASDAKCIALKAVDTKNEAVANYFTSGMNYIKGAVSWFTAQKSNNDPRECYWTNEMRATAPQLIPYILAVWTLSNASCYYESNEKLSLTKPRNAQIIAIMCILCLDVDSGQKKLINNLVEVGTGEGKSVIMAITAIVLALLDFDVYCACYSKLLSNRDQRAFNELFMAFGVDKNIQYETFNNILEQMINGGGDIRKITKNIVLGYEQKGDDDDDDDDDDGDEKKQQASDRQKILFIDEVDKFFSTDFFGKQYTPSCVIPKPEMKNLILFVWQQYINNSSNGNQITLEMIEQSDEYHALKNSFKPEWHDLLGESVKDIIDGIRTFKDDSYKIENGRDISYKFSDTYSTKVFYGFRTLFTYLHELDKGNITDEKHVHEKLTWFLKCGSFSYSEIPNDFYGILGVTGTLKSLSKKEHEVIQKSYGVLKYVVMPSLFDKSGKLEYAKNKDIFVIKREHFYNSLQGTINTYETNGDDAERPIIVFFKDEMTLDYFYNSEICAIWRTNDRIQKLTPDLSETEKKIGILNATKPRQLTFATEEYGRGIDFKVFDKTLKAKGMHVELTYWPDTLAEEIQIKGRTARQGDKGSFHIILNEDEIIDQCKVSKKNIKKHKDNGDLYEWLNKIRNKVFEIQYDEASSYVKQLRPIHEQSEQLAMSLRQKNILVAKEKLLLFNKGANIKSAAKLSMLIDATASMASCLTQCKTVLQTTIPKLIQFCTDNDAGSFEIQVIAYRNYNADAANILEFCPFTSDQNTLTKFIHSLRAKAGWGEEAVELAFNQLNRQEKQPNIIMIMGDAPAQTADDVTMKRKERGEKYWQTEKDGIFKQPTDWNKELTQFMSKNENTSIFTFYIDNDNWGKDFAKKNFMEIAKFGNPKKSRKKKSKPTHLNVGNQKKSVSKATHLNVGNQKKSVNLLTAALCQSILYTVNNGDMALVEKFKNQNKNLPTFL